MARPGVTREMIFEAADAIALEGKNPTVLMVRERLGGGSPNTISPHLAAWREQNEAKPTESLPPLPDAVQSAMRQVWGAAWQDAQTQLVDEREALATIRKDLEQERTEMMSEIERLDGDLERSREETRKGIEALDAEKIAHDQTRSEVRETKAISEEQRRRTEQLDDELRSARHEAQEQSTRATRLETELQHTQRDLATAQKQAQKTALEAESQKERLARLEQDIASEKRHSMELKDVIKTTGKKNDLLSQQLEEERQALGQIKQREADLRIEVATLKERAAHIDDLKEQVGVLQGQLAGLAKQVGMSKRT